MVKTKQNLVGMKFGRLTVVSQSEDFIDCGREDSWMERVL